MLIIRGIIKRRGKVKKKRGHKKQSVAELKSSYDRWAYNKQVESAKSFCENKELRSVLWTEYRYFVDVAKPKSAGQARRQNKVFRMLIKRFQDKTRLPDLDWI